MGRVKRDPPTFVTLNMPGQLTQGPELIEETRTDVGVVVSGPCVHHSSRRFWGGVNKPVGALWRNGRGSEGRKRSCAEWQPDKYRSVLTSSAGQEC